MLHTKQESLQIAERFAEDVRKCAPCEVEAIKLIETRGALAHFTDQAELFSRLLSEAIERYERCPSGDNTFKNLRLTLEILAKLGVAWPREAVANEIFDKLMIALDVGKGINALLIRDRTLRTLTHLSPLFNPEQIEKLACHDDDANPFDDLVLSAPRLAYFQSNYFLAAPLAIDTLFMAAQYLSDLRDTLSKPDKNIRTALFDLLPEARASILATCLLVPKLDQRGESAQLKTVLEAIRDPLEWFVLADTVSTLASHPKLSRFSQSISDIRNLAWLGLTIIDAPYNSMLGEPCAASNPALARAKKQIESDEHIHQKLSSRIPLDLFLSVLDPDYTTPSHSAPQLTSRLTDSLDDLAPASERAPNQITALTAAVAAWGVTTGHISGTGASRLKELAREALNGKAFEPELQSFLIPIAQEER